jgi:hemerythrin superfamily protein
MLTLVIDDLRKFFEQDNETIIYARTLYEGFREFFDNPRQWYKVYLDHDLGDDDDIMPLVRKIEEYAYDGILFDVEEFVIITANPVGRMKIHQALSKFYNVRFGSI